MEIEGQINVAKRSEVLEGEPAAAYQRTVTWNIYFPHILKASYTSGLKKSQSPKLILT